MRICKTCGEEVKRVPSSYPPKRNPDTYFYGCRCNRWLEPHETKLLEVKK